MTKEAYLERIRTRLQSLPPEDRERSLAFYAESIEDRMEDGMSEEEAVASMENPDEAARKIQMAMPLPALVKARVKDRRKMGALEIILLVLGSPIWLSLLLAALVVALSFVLVVWALVLALGAVALALAVSSVAVLASAVYAVFKLGLQAGVLALSAALLLAGLAILTGIATYWAGRGAAALSKAMLRGLKSLLIRKEEQA